jgi:hypothetical protein
MLEQLVLAIESSAEWRASKAAQYPDDKRNVSSSQSLSKLAKNLNALSGRVPWSGVGAVDK